MAGNRLLSSPEKSVRLNVDHETIRSQILDRERVPTLEESIEIVIQEESRFCIIVKSKMETDAFITKAR